jgi:hypothetical protein
MKFKLQIRPYLLLISSMNIAVASAQSPTSDKGHAVIYFEPANTVIVRLDTALYKQQKLPLVLKEGKYIIRAWAPTKELFTDTMVIHANKTTIVARHLKDSEGYRKYKDERYWYIVHKTATTYLPIPFTLAYSIYLLDLYNSNKKIMNQHLQNANTDAANYAKPGSASVTDKYLQAYTIEKNNYETYRIKNNHIVAVAAISESAVVLTSAVLLYFSSKIVKPAPYTETPLLSLNNLQIKSDYKSSCSLALVLTIKLTSR